MTAFLKPLMTAVALVLVTISAASAADPKLVLNLWATRPAENQATNEVERDTTTAKDGFVAGKSVIRLGHVSNPTLAIYPPSSGKNNGTAVLVCPGGGYNILAMDLEGTEVCDWLNSIGVTGVLLKYRVPRQQGT